MPHRIKIVPFLASVHLRLNNFFKLLLLVRRSKQTVLAFIRRFLIALSHRAPPPDKAAPTPVRCACSHDPGLQLAAYPPRQEGSPAGTLNLWHLLHTMRIDLIPAQPNQSPMQSSVSPECSTTVMDSGIPQNAVPNDKLTRQVDIVPFSPEELDESRNKTHGQMWAGSPP